jgi:phosphoribosylformylglycinamidine synthase subunit PurL
MGSKIPLVSSILLVTIAAETINIIPAKLNHTFSRMTSLTSEEYEYLREKLTREPNDLELRVIEAEWSEHCSYKSSRRLIKQLPTKGKNVLVGPGSDAAALDVGDGYALSVHIESHNHPSVVEPYGGAATGVGGVVRDIVSLGTRPIALLDALRFGNIDNSAKNYSRTKWLFRNVVTGIAHYGNCIGVPTVAGEVEFDASFDEYCLVDVASIGFGRSDRIIRNHASTGDYIILAGGATGREGMGGAAFASKQMLEENRSAVQVPDPFEEKLLIEAIVEAVEQHYIKALKDLGGGGLSCCLSELSDTLEKGFDIELSKIHSKENNLEPSGLMLSESQERMLFVTDSQKLKGLKNIFRKFGLRFSLIGRVKDNHNLVLRFKGKIVGKMPSNLVCHAPIATRLSARPRHIYEFQKVGILPMIPPNLQEVLYAMISNPSLASKSWVYEQYDHEVGTRTVLKPGSADAAVLRLTDNKFLSIKLDGNSKHCYLDPYYGTLGCLSESSRNVVCTGAEPIGIIDHLQFGNPENPQTFWSLEESVRAIVDFCKFMDIPVIGGKVSLYNETFNGPIKPTPVIGCIGIIKDAKWITRSALKPSNTIFIIGLTSDEMGGSEYYEVFHKIVGGIVPRLDLNTDRLNQITMLSLVRDNLITCAHDCSKGGLAIALCDMALEGRTGLEVNLDLIPNTCSRIDNLLFSESQSRFVFATSKPTDVENLLKATPGLAYARIGNSWSLSGYRNNKIVLTKSGSCVICSPLEELEKNYNSLTKTMS